MTDKSDAIRYAEIFKQAALNSRRRPWFVRRMSDREVLKLENLEASTDRHAPLQIADLLASVAIRSRRKHEAIALIPGEATGRRTTDIYRGLGVFHGKDAPRFAALCEEKANEP